MPIWPTFKNLKVFWECLEGIQGLLKNKPKRKFRKDTAWEWGKGQEEAFQSLRRGLTNSPILAWPDFSKTFNIHADSSLYAICAILKQEHEDGDHPIVYVSKVLTAAKKNYSTTDRVMLAITFALRKFRCYIKDYHFIVKTDHMDLMFLQTVREPAGFLGLDIGATRILLWNSLWKRFFAGSCWHHVQK